MGKKKIPEPLGEHPHWMCSAAGPSLLLAATAAITLVASSCIQLDAASSSMLAVQMLQGSSLVACIAVVILAAMLAFQLVL